MDSITNARRRTRRSGRRRPHTQGLSQGQRREPAGPRRCLACTLGNNEIVSFLGRSGCGKTTLLRILAGLMPASGGEVSIAGRPSVGAGRARSRWCSRPFALFPWLTVLQNVEIGLEAQGVGAGRAQPAGARGHRPDRPRRLRERLPQGTVGRHAPEGRHRARAGGAAQPAADGRGLLGARCADRGDACAPTSWICGSRAACRSRRSCWSRTISRRRC